MARHRVLVAAVAALLPLSAFAQAPKPPRSAADTFLNKQGGGRAKAKAVKAPPARKTAGASASAPIPGPQAESVHAPFSMDACGLCHERDDAKNPGKVTQAIDALCFSCHEDLGQMMKARRVVHAPAEQDCTGCHNPHNSKFAFLLADTAKNVCTGCHEDIGTEIDSAKVKHDTVTTGKQCMNCHNPHASDVDKLLTQLPYEQCVTCHGTDDLKDDQGRALTNFKTLLEKNKVWHGPIANKDCSGCHKVHGGEHFRLLLADYPEKFYAPYEPANYALCFRCHNDKNVQNPETTTTTKFRDGKRNLHYLHVNKEDRGRTCRACHEVHASERPHQIRESVPYGTKGWMLSINFSQTAAGGQCEKTCHRTKTYDNKNGSK